MGNDPRARFNWPSESSEAEASFAMWVLGMVLLPIGLLLFAVRRLARRLHGAGKGG